MNTKYNYKHHTLIQVCILNIITYTKYNHNHHTHIQVYILNIITHI